MSQPTKAQAALRAAAGAAAAPRQRTILDLLQDPKVSSGITSVCGKLLQPDRLLRLCITACKRNPKLLQCDPASVLGAIMTTAALGLEPNTIEQQAFLIPYKRRAKVGSEWVDVFDCEFQIGARGFVTLAYRAGGVKSLQAETIHEGDIFEHEVGSNGYLRYRMALKNRGQVVGAFSYAVLASDHETACVLPLEELEKVRAKSESWRTLSLAVANADNDKDRAKAEAKLAETPWVMWFDQMAAKSAIKRHAKQLPVAAGQGLAGSALAAAAELDDRAGAHVIDLPAMSDPEFARAVVAGEEEPPAIGNDQGEQLQGEAFGATARQREAVPVGAPAAAPAPAAVAAAAAQTDKRRAAPAKNAPAAGGPPVTFEEVRDMLAKATTNEARDTAMDVARSALSAQQVDDLRAFRLGLPELDH